MDKGSGSGIFPDPDPGDPKRPDSDPDPQHWREGWRGGEQGRDGKRGMAREGWRGRVGEGGMAREEMSFQAQTASITVNRLYH